MFDRLIKLIGENNLNKLQNTRVLIVGVGGVGGFALESLVRSGIGHITIVDGDTYEISNLNRQIGANSNNIGKYKVEEEVNRIKCINPSIDIVGINSNIDATNIDNYKEFDYIIDACDDVNAKVLLIKLAINNNIKIICSCGTGKRLNPSKLEISTLEKTYNDPLAKVLRSKLKKEGITTKVPVVFSSELPINNDTTIASMISVPATSGIYLANWVIRDIVK